MENESLLTGRPIVTGYGWCTVEASKYLQKRFRSILVRFKDYLESSSLPYSILGNSYELVGLIGKTNLSSVGGCTFVTTLLHIMQYRFLNKRRLDEIWCRECDC